MTLLDHSFTLFLAIALGILGQMLLSGLVRRAAAGGNRPGVGCRVGQAALILLWAGLGAALLVGGVRLFAEAAILPGVGNLALGVGLALMGIGYALEQPALRGIGVPVVAIGPIAIGADAILNGQPIVGGIAAALGVGMLVGNLRGRVGAFGQAVAGILIAASGLFILAGVITEPGLPVGMTALASAAMLALGALSAAVGFRGLLAAG